MEFTTSPTTARLQLIQADDLKSLPVCLSQESHLLAKEWLHSRSITFNPSLLVTGLRFIGQLDLRALRCALNEIVTRHAALRSTFLPNPEIPASLRTSMLFAYARTALFVPGLYRQVVHEHAPLAIEQLNLASLSPDGKTAEIHKLLSEHSVKPFDYEQPPLMRAILFSLELTEHLLVLVVDHIVADAWSMRILRKEIATFYLRHIGGTASPLSPPSLSFPDFATHQQGLIAAGRFSDAIDWWQTQWSRFGSSRIALSDLPFALLPPKESTDAFAVERVSLNLDRVADLRLFVRKERVTLFILFLAAYGAVLHFYTKKPLVGIWGHFAGRRSAATHNSIGCFANTHLVGIDLTGDPSGRELLDRTRDFVLQGQKYGDLPLAAMWQTLRSYPLHRDAKLLIDVNVVDRMDGYSSAGGGTINRACLPDLPLERFSSLGVYIDVDPEKVVLRSKYRQDSFSATAVKQLLRDLSEIVIAIADSPDSRLSELARLAWKYPKSPTQTMEMQEFVVIGSELLPALRTAPPDVTDASVQGGQA